jgi:hypothetical protein
MCVRLEPAQQLFALDRGECLIFFECEAAAHGDKNKKVDRLDPFPFGEKKDFLNLTPIPPAHRHVYLRAHARRPEDPEGVQRRVERTSHPTHSIVRLRPRTIQADAHPAHSRATKLPRDLPGHQHAIRGERDRQSSPACVRGELNYIGSHQRFTAAQDKQRTAPNGDIFDPAFRLICRKLARAGPRTCGHPPAVAAAEIARRRRLPEKHLQRIISHGIFSRFPHTF